MAETAYEKAEREVSEHAWSGAPDRRQFVRSCVHVRTTFLNHHLKEWPWDPGAQEEMDADMRMERARKSEELFSRWMVTGPR